MSELLISYTPEILSGFDDDLNALVSSEYNEVRNAASQALIISGIPLDALARQDKDALIAALASLPDGTVPASASLQIQALVESIAIDAADGIEQIVRLSADDDALFAWLAALAEPARGIGFDRWDSRHTVAMAAMRGMSLVDDADWPEGYDDYRIAQADPEIYALGQSLYHIEEGGCIKCHGPNGFGLEGFPPLANSPWVLGDPARAASIIRYGMAGEMTMHDGQVFNSTMEPPLGGELDTNQIAAILTYIRQTWGNYAAPVEPHQVTQLLKPALDEMFLKPEAVLARYPLRYDALLGDNPKPAVLTIAGWKEPPCSLFLMLAGVAGLNALILLGTLAQARARTAA